MTMKYFTYLESIVPKIMKNDMEFYVLCLHCITLITIAISLIYDQAES